MLDCLCIMRHKQSKLEGGQHAPASQPRYSPVKDRACTHSTCKVRAKRMNPGRPPRRPRGKPPQPLRNPGLIVIAFVFNVVAFTSASSFVTAFSHGSEAMSSTILTGRDFLFPTLSNTGFPLRLCSGFSLCHYPREEVLGDHMRGPVKLFVVGELAHILGLGCL